jgi:hypothetical protein
MSTQTIVILVVLAVLLGGTGPWWPYSTGWGYAPSGLIGLVFLVVIVYALLGGRRGGPPL